MEGNSQCRGPAAVLAQWLVLFGASDCSIGPIPQQKGEKAERSFGSPPIAQILAPRPPPAEAGYGRFALVIVLELVHAMGLLVVGGPPATISPIACNTGSGGELITCNEKKI